MNNKKKENNVSDYKIITLEAPIKAVGLTTGTNMKSVFKDVANILKKYMSLKDQYGILNQKEPWEYVSLSKDFTDNNHWNYLTGHVVIEVSGIPDVFTAFEIPAGTYAIFPIRPKMKFLIGLEIVKTKKYVYKEWLKKSPYEFSGYEFEFNDEAMFKISPNYIDLYVGITKQGQAPC